MILLLLNGQKHEKGQVLASFCRCYFLKLVKNTGLEPKIEREALQKVAKNLVFFLDFVFFASQI